MLVMPNVPNAYTTWVARVEALEEHIHEIELENMKKIKSEQKLSRSRKWKLVIINKTYCNDLFIYCSLLENKATN